MIKGFKEFILRGNVIDLAVAVVIGAAFTVIVNAIVAGLINPLIALLFQADSLDAVGPTLDMIEGAGKNFCFVLSQAKPNTRLVGRTLPALASHGKVSPVVIHHREDYPTAALDGRAVTELGSRAAAAEVRELLDYVRLQLRGRGRK